MIRVTMLAVCLALLAGCAAVQFESCRPDGSCTRVTSRKDHPSGVTVIYNPTTGEVRYQSGASVTNRSDLAAMLEMLRMLRGGGGLGLPGIGWVDDGTACQVITI